jgi:N-acetylneuraminate synthase
MSSKVEHVPRCEVIAEVGSVHDGSFGNALRLIETAAAAGADAVKFQLHYPEHEMLAAAMPPSDNFAKPLDEIVRETHLTEEQHEQLRNHCKARGVEYLCTAYSREAADALAEIGVRMFKIGSGETMNHPLLRWIAKHGRPMLVATGMTELDEVDRTVHVLRETGVDFGLMHCTSEYPPVYEDINLRMVPFYQERYGVVVGHSDHSPDITTALGAVTLGAHIVEKHFTLTRDQPGPDHPVSIEPHELTEMVRRIRILEAACGAEKAVFEREKQIRAWAHHSVVTLKPIAAGERFDDANVWVKRPGTGIPAEKLEEVLGRTAARDLDANVQVAWADVSA